MLHLLPAINMTIKNADLIGEQGILAILVSPCNDAILFMATMSFRNLSR